MIDLALILAAGSGTRMADEYPAHKALVPLAGVPLLWRICQVLQKAGIAEVIVVTGYRGDDLRTSLGQADLDLKITFAENRQREKSNGLSVLAAEHLLDRDYLLLMADHIFDPSIVRSLCREPVGTDKVILAIDRKIDRIYDIDDATKVRLSGDRIVAIDKNLDEYNAIDTGLFVCSQALARALNPLAATGDCSLSDGMRKIAEAGNLRYLDIGDGWWQDVDTPGALQHAKRLLAAHLTG